MGSFRCLGGLILTWACLAGEMEVLSASLRSSLAHHCICNRCFEEATLLSDLPIQQAMAVALLLIMVRGLSLIELKLAEWFTMIPADSR